MPEPASQNTASPSHWLVVALVLAILGAGIAFLNLHLRSVIRHEILQQDGQVLYAASLTEQLGRSQLEADLQDAFADDPQAIADLSFLFEPEEQLLSILEASKLRGVFAVRLYDSSGAMLTSFPPGLVRSASLSPAELGALSNNAPVTELQASADLLSYMRPETFAAEPERVPLIRVLVPLQRHGTGSGAAEFVLDGQNVANAFAAVDRDVIRYGLLIFLVGGTVIALALWWAFSRLQRSNALLVQRTQSLLRANHELTLAAKTSAVGAITAHLIHDLKNPLFGLQSFVNLKGSVALDEEDWNIAIDTTRRMQKVITDVVSILQQESTVTAYELSIDELLSILSARLEPAARKAEVHLDLTSGARATLSNRHANIVILIATNILQNAIQATPSGGRVGARVSPADAGITFEFFDTAGGLPPSVQEHLFTPCRSTKSGGTGLGLAISKQLATHLGADLTVKQTGPSGTIFQLTVPESVFIEAIELAPSGI